MKLCVKEVVALLVVLVAITSSLPTSPGSGADCDPYPYCDGTSFNATMILSVRKVTCDRARHPRDHCCLPQAKHFVCYGITVDGQYLNYDTDPLRTTDFTGLCAAMAKLHAPGKKVGKHSSATIDVGHGGTLVWRYGDWTETERGTQYIKNVACEFTTV
jgi:hypothetical protein